MAELQRRSWAALPAELSEPMLAGISLAEMTSAWKQVIERPAQARHRLLVAIAETRICGFATTAPAEDADADPARQGTVEEFVIDPPARRRGHGSRLLNAAADTLRADGFTAAVWWVLAGDDELRRFLHDAGWGADGAHREIGTEDGLVRVRQLRLHTDLAARP